MINDQIQKLGIQTPQLSELYKDIELNDEEKTAVIEKALFEARYEKYAAMQREQYREKIMMPFQAKKYSSTQLFKFLEDTPGFVIDTDNKPIVELLCKYFTDDPGFEEKGYSLKKGILLFGGVGVGKTFLMEMFRQNQKHSYQTATCQDVEGTFARNGDDHNDRTGEHGLRRYYTNVPITRNQYSQESIGFLFDDLGQENTNTKYYGTERNVMVEVLSQRYNHGLFTSTHITTNLSAEQIKETYGLRIGDRMREMFNLISFNQNAKSRRK